MYIHVQCGVCGKTFGGIKINEDSVYFDKEVADAYDRETMFDGQYVCSDCYDMIKHLSTYVCKDKE